jgi:hypothetical protein
VCVCVCVCKGTAFSALIFWKIALMFLWSDTLLISEKSFRAWRWVMQFLPGTCKWQLQESLTSYVLHLKHHNFNFFVFFLSSSHTMLFSNCLLIKKTYCISLMSWGSCHRIDWLWPDDWGLISDRHWELSLRPHVQTGCVSHPASYPEATRRGVKLTNQLHKTQSG